jgi:predicted ATPase/class 3 adenylate cyclase
MTHALLLTDLVDSTALTERLGLHEAAALGARHDRIARDLLAQFGGREIDKTDGFLFLFEDATAAADYALAYHRALKSLELTARAGLHVGEVVLRENSVADVLRGAKPVEVEGLAKPLAARVMGVAQGGQTLATAAAVEALRLGRTAPTAEGRVDTTLTGRIAVSHGHWRLKGISEPLELFELAFAKDRTFAPPPDGAKAWRVVWSHEAWLPVRDIPRALPREWDTFVGRTSDLRALSEMLDGGAGLVTVIGIGGTGKTRLVTHFGWSTLGQFPGGTWFCDLSEARGVEGIVSAVATALDVPLGKEDPVAQLGHAIAGRGDCLMILDNFEQVARHAAETVLPWVNRAKDARFVVTSREVLGLPGEHALALAPLPREDGVTLFHRRARQAKADFVPRPTDDEAISQLVTLLDGLPLAIELAAARVRMMPPATILQRMRERFRLLTSTGARHTRHATLRAALDWSWDLLSPDEQQALAQLSVFEGGLTLEAAEAVLSLGELWPMDAVQALVDKSLVRRATEERFDLLVSVQEYGSEKLDGFGGRAEAEVRHGEHFASFGSEEAVEGLYGHNGLQRRRSLAADLDNLTAACRRAIARGDGATAASTCRAAVEVLVLKGPFAAGLALARAVLEVPQLGPGERMGALVQAGRTAMVSGQMNEARARYEEALGLARDRGDRRCESQCLGALGSLVRDQGRMDEARAWTGQALALARALGDRRGERMWLGDLGMLDHMQGNLDEARASYERALAIARERGDRRNEGFWLSNLGLLDKELGRTEEARAHLEQALALSREIGDRRGESGRLSNLGLLHAQLGQSDEARGHHEVALAIAREIGDRRNEGINLGNLGTRHLEDGRLDAAGPALREALAIHRDVGFRYGQAYWLSGLARLEALVGSPGWVALADEAVQVSATFPFVQAGALAVRARLRLDHGPIAGARADVEAAKALGPRGDVGASVALVDARLCWTEGDREGAGAALADAERRAAEAHLGPLTPVGKEIAELRGLLAGGS